MIRRIQLAMFASLACIAGLNAMQPQQPRQKTHADELVGAAGAANIKGVNYWLFVETKDKKKVPVNAISATYMEEGKLKGGRTALGAAAKGGYLDIVNLLLRQPDINPDLADAEGLTPLAWAAIQFNKKNQGPDVYEKIVRALVNKGANINARDLRGLTILHHAAQGGNPKIVELLLSLAAARDVNAEGIGERGRTPLAEVIRNSIYAITRMPELENTDFDTKQQFAEAYNQAMQGLHAKLERKLSESDIIKIIGILRRAGARTDSPDEFGNTVDYYINNVHVTDEADRKALLGALGVRDSGREIRYSEQNLPQAIDSLKNLHELLTHYGLGKAIDKIKWVIELAQNAPRGGKVSFLSVGMPLIVKLKEVAKTKLDPELFNAIQEPTNQIRTILRDAILTIKGTMQPMQHPLMAPVPAALPAPLKPAPMPPVEGRKVEIAVLPAQPLKPAAAVVHEGQATPLHPISSSVPTTAGESEPTTSTTENG